MIDFAEQPGGGLGQDACPKSKAQSPKSGPIVEAGSGNLFLVGTQGADVIIVAPPSPGRPMTRAQAINLAAWLRVIADPTGEQFERVVKEIVES